MYIAETRNNSHFASQWQAVCGFMNSYAGTQRWITHSMGGLTMMSGIYHGRCKGGGGMTGTKNAFYSSACPIIGSNIIITMYKWCWEGGKGSNSATRVIMNKLINKLGYCNRHHLRDTFYYLHPSRSISKLYIGYAHSTFKDRVDGMLCAHSAWGLWSLFSNFKSAEHKTLEAVSALHSNSDGMVDFYQCTAGRPDWCSNCGSSKWYNLWYWAGINHDDAKCRNGNGWWGKHRLPCKWFANRRNGAVSMYGESGGGGLQYGNRF
jgi:hypothetical protein